MRHKTFVYAQVSDIPGRAEELVAIRTSANNQPFPLSDAHELPSRGPPVSSFLVPTTLSRSRSASSQQSSGVINLERRAVLDGGAHERVFQAKGQARLGERNGNNVGRERRGLCVSQAGA